MVLLRVLNWNLDAYNFKPPRREAFYEMIRSPLASGDGAHPCVVVLTEVPKLLLDEGRDSLQQELSRCGFKVHFHRPGSTSQRHGAVIALSQHFSFAEPVTVPENLHGLIDNLVLEAALDGVGAGIVFALRPLVRDGGAEDYAKRADGLFGLMNEAVASSRTVGADFILGAGDFNHAMIRGGPDESWKGSEVRRLYRGKYQEPIAYQKIKTELGQHDLALVTPRGEDGLRLDTSIGQYSLDHTIAPTSWSVVSSSYFERPHASSGEHKLQVSEFAINRSVVPKP
ncbi:hypothetical protein ACXR2W_02295 [Leucobacter sp. HY1908]